MPRRTKLEAELLELTMQFVAAILDRMKGASFTEVAHARAPEVNRLARRPQHARTVQRPRQSRVTLRGGPEPLTGRRRELADSVLELLRQSGQPQGVRALARALGVAQELVTPVVKALREHGRIEKVGDRRKSAYITRAA